MMQYLKATIQGVWAARKLLVFIDNSAHSQSSTVLSLCNAAGTHDI
jgi:hypothetical protein